MCERKLQTYKFPCVGRPKELSDAISPLIVRASPILNIGTCLKPKGKSFLFLLLEYSTSYSRGKIPFGERSGITPRELQRGKLKGRRSLTTLNNLPPWHFKHRRLDKQVKWKLSIPTWIWQQGWELEIKFFTVCAVWASSRC